MKADFLERNEEQQLKGPAVAQKADRAPLETSVYQGNH